MTCDILREFFTDIEMTNASGESRDLPMTQCSYHKNEINKYAIHLLSSYFALSLMHPPARTHTINQASFHNYYRLSIHHQTVTQ